MLCTNHLHLIKIFLVCPFFLRTSWFDMSASSLQHVFSTLISVRFLSAFLSHFYVLLAFLLTFHWYFQFLSYLAALLSKDPQIQCTHIYIYIYLRSEWWPKIVRKEGIISCYSPLDLSKFVLILSKTTSFQVNVKTKHKEDSNIFDGKLR